LTIVVTGASGFLGRRVLACCNAGDDDVVGVSIDDDAIATIHALAPDAVVHLAAVNPGLGDSVAMRAANVDLTHAVAVAAAATRARLVHVSTDVVHDGTAAPYRDDARPQPFGEYARSKAEGEATLLAANPGAVAVRTSLLWDPAEADRWVEEMAIALATPRPVALWSDQYRQPTLAPDLAAALVRLATDPHLANVCGPLNLTGDDVMRRSEFGHMLLEHFAIPGREAVREVPAPPGVPRDLRLDCTRAHALGLHVRGPSTVLGLRTAV
jgi:dTDP-4-dehydrorhamnose reductase